MSEALQVILGILVILIPIISGLVMALYSKVNKERDEMRDDIKLSKATVDEFLRQHTGLCQKHEDCMASDRRDIDELRRQMHNTRYNLADLFARVAIFDHKSEKMNHNP